MYREDYTKNIITHLSRLVGEVELLNAVNFYDINIVSEDFFARLLNMIFGGHLVNLNASGVENFPGIDLGDVLGKIAFQVTSTSTSGKIKKTLETFNKNEYYKQYDKLRFLILKNKSKSFRFTYDTEKHKYFSLKDDVLDIETLCKELRHLDTTKLKEISEYLEQELGRFYEAENTIANEVSTIIDLVEFLSSNRSDTANPRNDDPDPEGKITVRFSDYSKVLLDEISRYLPLYTDARIQAEEALGLDRAKIRFIRSYLQTISQRFLHDSATDPIKALDAMTDSLLNQLAESGKKHDLQAVRYYLIYELIQCNVFPN